MAPRIGLRGARGNVLVQGVRINRPPGAWCRRRTRLIQPPEVVSVPVISIWLRYEDYRAGPGTMRLLDDPELWHPADFGLDGLPPGLRDPIGGYSHLHSRCRPDVMMGDRGPPRELGKYIPVLHDKVVQVLLLGWAEPSGTRDTPDNGAPHPFLPPANKTLRGHFLRSCPCPNGLP